MVYGKWYEKIKNQPMQFFHSYNRRLLWVWYWEITGDVSIYKRRQSYKKYFQNPWKKRETGGDYCAGVVPFPILTHNGLPWWCMYAQLLSHVWLSATPWTVAHQALLSMGSPRHEYWSRKPFILQVVQWIGTHLPMQRTWVQTLVQEDFICHRAAKPICHTTEPRLQSPQATTTEPVCHNSWSPCLQEPVFHKRSHTHHKEEKTPLRQLEKALTKQWRPSADRNK